MAEANASESCAPGPSGPRCQSRRQPIRLGVCHLRATTDEREQLPVESRVPPILPPRAETTARSKIVQAGGRLVAPRVSSSEHRGVLSWTNAPRKDNAPLRPTRSA
jgi:hypothetical protein